MGLLSRRKGKEFELLVANALKALYQGAKRGCAQARNGREQEDGKADIENTPWWIECCHSATANVWTKLAQAKASTDGRLCVVIARRNRSAVVAAMELDDFKLLLQDVEILRELRAKYPEIVEGITRSRAP